MFALMMLSRYKARVCIWSILWEASVSSRKASRMEVLTEGLLRRKEDRMSTV